MGLIDEELINSELEKIDKMELDDPHGWSEDFFKNGVSFAETELQNLVIEFAEWCKDNGYVFDKYERIWSNEETFKLYTSKEVFSKFIE